MARNLFVENLLKEFMNVLTRSLPGSNLLVHTDSSQLILWQ